MWYAIIVVLLFVFLGVSMYAHRTVKEGMTTPPDMLQLLTKNNNTLLDELNIVKYRGKYEDLVIHLEDWANLQMLKLVVDGKLGTVTLDPSVVEQFNSLCNFKTNLNDTMKFLDKTKLQ